MARRTSSAKRSLTNARRREGERRRTMYQKAGLLGGGYILGKSVGQGGFLASIPSVLGVPKLGVAGTGAYLASMFVRGNAGAVLEGFGDSAAAIAAYQFGAGQTIAGADADPSTAELERDLARLQAESDAVRGLDDEDDFIEGDFEDLISGDDDNEGDAEQGGDLASLAELEG